MPGAPLLLDEFEPSRLWFAEHCCLNGATDRDLAPEIEVATRLEAVQSKCSAAAYSEVGHARYDP